MGGVVYGGHAHHLFFIDSGIDFHGRPRAGADDGAVQEQAVHIGSDAGDHGGVLAR